MSRSTRDQRPIPPSVLLRQRVARGSMLTFLTLASAAATAGLVTRQAEAEGRPERTVTIQPSSIPTHVKPSRSPTSKPAKPTPKTPARTATRASKPTAVPVPDPVPVEQPSPPSTTPPKTPKPTKAPTSGPTAPYDPDDH